MRKLVCRCTYGSIAVPVGLACLSAAALADEPPSAYTSSEQRYLPHPPRPYLSLVGVGARITRTRLGACATRRASATVTSAETPIDLQRPSVARSGHAGPGRASQDHLSKLRLFLATMGTRRNVAVCSGKVPSPSPSTGGVSGALRRSGESDPWTALWVRYGPWTKLSPRLVGRR